MVATRVFGNDATVGFAGSQGNQLNVFKPAMAYACLESDPGYGRRFVHQLRQTLRLRHRAKPHKIKENSTRTSCRSRLSSHRLRPGFEDAKNAHHKGIACGSPL